MSKRFLGNFTKVSCEFLDVILDVWAGIQNASLGEKRPGVRRRRYLGTPGDKDCSEAKGLQDIKVVRARNMFLESGEGCGL